jgi:hypothetical protein
MDGYVRYIERCYENNQLTNNGPLARELKARLEDYLGVKNLLLVANGTLALQIAYKALNVTGKAITTPFTFVATSSSLKWEGNACPKTSEQWLESFEDPKCFLLHQDACGRRLPWYTKLFRSLCNACSIYQRYLSKYWRQST